MTGVAVVPRLLRPFDRRRPDLLEDGRPTPYFCPVIEGIGAIGRVGTSRAALLSVGIASLAALPITPLGAEHLGTADGPWG